MTLQNAENFTVFFGLPSPKAMARQGRIFLRNLKALPRNLSGFQTERQFGKGAIQVLCSLFTSGS
jgi:hypothetical protein